MGHGKEMKWKQGVPGDAGHVQGTGKVTEEHRQEWTHDEKHEKETGTSKESQECWEEMSTLYSVRKGEPWRARWGCMKAPQIRFRKMILGEQH